jgi:hypothetical protein
MKRLLAFLEKQSLPVTLLCALLAILFLWPQMVSATVMPYTDGNAYVHRAFALYGFLHSGQWRSFWELFSLPRQSLLSPQELLFFLLPRAWAGLPSYGAIQLVCNNVLLALALWNLCRVFERREWAPAMFLLCACENYSFDYPYFFFLDLTFTAFGALVLSWQVDAWRRPTPRAGALAGIGLGLLYWLKPANALLFTFTFVLSEIGLIAWNHFDRAKKEGAPPVLRRLGWLAVGLLPVVLAAVACGALQSILLIIHNNELSPEWETHLAATGLFRLFYFPLCFAYFYNALVLIFIVGAVALATAYFRRAAGPSVEQPKAFPVRALLILVFSYLVLGEIFSFVMLVKTMRFLVGMLPVLWLFLFWLADRWRLRGGVLLAGAVAYVAVLADQVATNYFDSAPLSPDKYLLADNWYDYFPMAWSRYDAGPRIAAHLETVVRAELPEGGRVGVSTERVFLDGRSLSLLLNGAALLEGRPPLYSCVRLFNPAGQYSPAAFSSSRLMLLYVAQNAQYSAFTWRENTNLLSYVPGHWADPAQAVELTDPRGQLLGYAFPLAKPVTAAQLADAMRWCGAPGPMTDDRIDDYIHGTHYSGREALRLLADWARKRF